MPAIEEAARGACKDVPAAELESAVRPHVRRRRLCCAHARSLLQFRMAREKEDALRAELAEDDTKAGVAVAGGGDGVGDMLVLDKDAFDVVDSDSDDGGDDGLDS